MKSEIPLLQLAYTLARAVKTDVYRLQDECPNCPSISGGRLQSLAFRPTSSPAYRPTLSVTLNIHTDVTAEGGVKWLVHVADVGLCFRCTHFDRSTAGESERWLPSTQSQDRPRHGCCPMRHWRRIINNSLIAIIELLSVLRNRLLVREKLEFTSLNPTHVHWLLTNCGPLCFTPHVGDFKEIGPSS